jgi:hypothetical protein
MSDKIWTSERETAIREHVDHGPCGVEKALLAEVERLKADNKRLVERAYAMHEVAKAARDCMESGPGPGHWPRFDALRRAVEALDRPKE